MRINSKDTARDSTNIWITGKSYDNKGVSYSQKAPQTTKKLNRDNPFLRFGRPLIKRNMKVNCSFHSRNRDATKCFSPTMTFENVLLAKKLNNTRDISSKDNSMNEEGRPRTSSVLLATPKHK